MAQSTCWDDASHLQTNVAGTLHQRTCGSHTHLAGLKLQALLGQNYCQMWAEMWPRSQAEHHRTCLTELVGKSMLAHMPIIGETQALPLNDEQAWMLQSARKDPCAEWPQYSCIFLSTGNCSLL